MCDNCDWDDYATKAQEIIDTCETILEENPTSDAADEFVNGDGDSDGVTAKAEGMLEWIEEKEHVTDKMKKAIDNMLGGAKNWLR